MSIYQEYNQYLAVFMPIMIRIIRIRDKGFMKKGSSTLINDGSIASFHADHFRYHRKIVMTILRHSV